MTCPSERRVSTDTCAIGRASREVHGHLTKRSQAIPNAVYPPSNEQLTSLCKKDILRKLTDEDQTEVKRPTAMSANKKSPQPRAWSALAVDYGMVQNELS